MTICPSSEELCRWLEAGTDTDTDGCLVAHLETCASCQEELERLTALGGAAVGARASKFSTPVAGGNELEQTVPVLSPLHCLLHQATEEPGQAKDPGAGRSDYSLRQAGLPVLPGYEMEAELGRGGMGVVYKARQVRLNRLVAVKMIRSDHEVTPEQLVRFGVEGETVARLQHPNIVQIHEVGVQHERPYLVLEFVAGGNLQARGSGQPQPARLAASLLEPLARGMQHAHQQGIVHRDLKPANVLLVGDSDMPLDQCLPKITDFGLARLLDTDLRLTQTGSVAGTPSYMAPEQARPGAEVVGPAADIYALGVILYELLTGRPPFLAATALEVLRQVVECEPVPPSQLVRRVPRDLETICLMCLRKEPGRRYASAGALAEDLCRFLDGKPVRARPVGTLERTARWGRRNPILAAALAAVVLTVSGAFVWINHEKNKARTLAVEKDQLAQSETTARQQAETALAHEKAAFLARDAAARRLQAINDYLLRDMLASTDQWGNRTEKLTMREVLDKAATGVARRFAGEPELAEPVREVLGHAYTKVGQPRLALEQFTARLALCRQLHGDADPVTLQAWAHRISALVRCELDADTARDAELLLPLSRRILGAEALVTLQVTEDLAASLCKLNRGNEALKLQEEVLAVRRRTAGPEHYRTLGSIDTLAKILIELGRPAEALQLCDDSLPVFNRVFGPQRLDTLILRNERALCLLSLGRLDEAEKECRELLVPLRREAGPEHTDTLDLTNNLACVLLLRNRAAEACPLFETCLPPLRQRQGAENPRVVHVEVCYAAALAASGRNAEAEALFERVLPVQRRVLPASDPTLLFALQQRALALLKQAKFDQAEPVWQEVVQGRRKILPTGHWLTAEAEVMLGACQIGQGRFAEAEPLLLLAHQTLARARAPAAPAGKVEFARLILAKLYDNWGKPEQAAAWRKKTL